MKVAMIDGSPEKPSPVEAARGGLAPRLRGTMPAAGLIGAGLITLAWWLVVARGLWLGYEWISA